MDQIQNSKQRRHKETKLDQYRSVSPTPEYIQELAMTGLSSRGKLFSKILGSIENDSSISETEKVIMICELLYAPAQEMKDKVKEEASFGVKMNDAVVAVYGATIYPILRRVGALGDLKEFVNLNNGIILSGGTSWNSIVPAAIRNLVDAEARADAASEYSGIKELSEEEIEYRKEGRMIEIARAKKYWNADLIQNRVSDILDVVPEVINSLFGRFSVSDSEIHASVLDVLVSRDPMKAEEFNEPQVNELYNYWIVFSAAKTITPALMSNFISEFCLRTRFSLSKLQRATLKEYAEGLFMLQPDEVQKKDARKIMERIVKFCSKEEFKESGRAFTKLEYYYALYWNENKKNDIKVPPFSPDITRDNTFRNWLAKRISLERRLEYISENITEADLMKLIHDKSLSFNHEDPENHPSNIYLEPRSTNTRENADETIKILEEIIASKPEIKKLVVISDWQYLLRQVQTTRKAIADAIAKKPDLAKTLGQIEILGWPADRISPYMATRFKDGQSLINMGLSELSKIVKYEKDVEEVLYNIEDPKHLNFSKLGIYIGETDEIGDDKSECKPLGQYLRELSPDLETEDIELE